MTEFEEILQECLHDLEQGASSVDECLGRHPEHAQELEPILLVSESLERAGQAPISDAFKARVRARLIQEMHAHPRTSRLNPGTARSGFMFIHRTPARSTRDYSAALVRLAVSLTAILLALLVTGTAYAQSTLPGDAFYGWKLASEDAWRAVSADPVGTDLVIAERRVNELIVVRDDPALRAQALEEYLETVARLRSQAGTEDEARIVQTLDSQIARLRKLGILLSQSDPATLPSDEPVAPTPVSPTVNPLPTVQTPHVEPTDLPDVTPTVQVPLEILPTVEIPPELLPTFEIPPPIR